MEPRCFSSLTGPSSAMVPIIRVVVAAWASVFSSPGEDLQHGNVLGARSMQPALAFSLYGSCSGVAKEAPITTEKSVSSWCLRMHRQRVILLPPTTPTTTICLVSSPGGSQATYLLYAPTRMECKHRP